MRLAGRDGAAERPARIHNEGVVISSGTLEILDTREFHTSDGARIAAGELPDDVDGWPTDSIRSAVAVEVNRNGQREHSLADREGVCALAAGDGDLADRGDRPGFGGAVDRDPEPVPCE